MHIIKEVSSQVQSYLIIPLTFGTMKILNYWIFGVERCTFNMLKVSSEKTQWSVTQGSILSTSGRDFYLSYKRFKVARNHAIMTLAREWDVEKH